MLVSAQDMRRNDILRWSLRLHWNCPQSDPAIQVFHCSVTRVPGKQCQRLFYERYVSYHKLLTQRSRYFSTKPLTYAKNNIHVVGWETSSYVCVITEQAEPHMMWLLEFCSTDIPEEEEILLLWLQMSRAAGYDQNPKNTSIRVHMHELRVNVGMVQIGMARAMPALRI